MYDMPREGEKIWNRSFRRKPDA